MSFDRFLGFGTDPCVVLDHRGTIAAVNDVWSDRARAAGAVDSAAVGVDYVEVCRRAAHVGAPQARLALDTVSELLAGGRRSASLPYPCTTRAGVRWFRADLVAVGSTGHVGIRHVDVTADRSSWPNSSLRDVVDTTTVLLTEAGLRLALDDALDGPPHPTVLVLATDLAAHRGPDVAVALATAAGSASAPIDAVARLGDHTLALLITAPDTTSAMASADSVVDAVARVADWEVARWALAVAGRADTTDTVLARARRGLVRSAAGIDNLVAHADHAERTARLHTAAAALTDAIDHFERAVERGVDMHELRRLDRAVVDAEHECLAAADECRTPSHARFPRRRPARP